MCPTAHRPEGATPTRPKEAKWRVADGNAGTGSQARRTTTSAVRRPAALHQVRPEACSPTPPGTITSKAVLQEVNEVSEDVSGAEGRGVDETKADPPKGADSVHEETREKGERAREEREKIEQQTTREQHERNHNGGLEAPPGD